MNNFTGILLEQYQRHSDMQLMDLFKLIYQNEFGCGHLIADEKDNYGLFLAEWEHADCSNMEDVIEPIGNGYVRLNIGAAKNQNMDPGIIHRMFIESAGEQGGSYEHFIDKMGILRTLLEQGTLPYSSAEIDDFLQCWEQDGRPLLRHSSRYRHTYKPAYRVVKMKYSRLLPVLTSIHAMKSQKDYLVVGIDGRCGAGKTTLSHWLSLFLNARVVHMDDFFLPMELRTKERLGEAGGNIHYERFQEEVIPGIVKNEPLKYRVFDCAIMDYSRMVSVEKHPIIIVEGAYAMHPRFGEIYDYKIFCDITKENQKERIIERNGPMCFQQFEERWIPMEEAYLRAFIVMKNCDTVLCL